MNRVVVVVGLVGHAVALAATSQLMRNDPLPPMLNGPSATMLPPRNVMLLLEVRPPAQSMYQSPRGTMTSPDGEQEYTDVQRLNPVGAPLPCALTRSSIDAVPALGQPFAAEQL